MADPDDMIVPMLQQAPDFIKGLDAKIDRRFDFVEARLIALEEHRKWPQHAQATGTLFGKLVTGEFEKRVETLEQKVRELELHK